MYEWVPFGKTAPRRLGVWKLVLNYLKSQWPTSYRDTTGLEDVSEHILKPFNLFDEIAWGVSFKHFEASQKIPDKKGVAIGVYIDDKYNDFTEKKYPGGGWHKVRIYCSVDLTYRFTESITTLDGDDFPLQYEGNKNMINNILSTNVTAMESLGLHNVEVGRTVFDGRYADEEIFLERLSRDVDPKAFAIGNDIYWSYRKIYIVEAWEYLHAY